MKKEGNEWCLLYKEEFHNANYISTYINNILVCNNIYIIYVHSYLMCFRFILYIYIYIYTYMCL